ncbi:MAG: VTT domain-containing protein [Candidatus Nomurabacteria bacterium]|nr:VTT domain-containing protein [Candidatus Nomurabacteria bacterium]
MHGSFFLKFFLANRYWTLLPLALVEGPILALAVGFMAHIGYFNFIYALIIIILGDFLPDSAYYALGRFGNKEKILARFDTKSKIISSHFNFIEKAWKEHTTKTMFISKIAYGLSTPLLITAGLAKLEYWRFVRWALCVTVIQYGILMTLGYYLGSSYSNATFYVKDAGILVAIIATVFIFGFFALQKYTRKKVEEIDHLENI